MSSFLTTARMRLLTVVLLLHAAAFYGLGRTEPVFAPKSLKDFPTAFGGWKLLQEGVIEKEILDVLKADDVITRTYTDGNKHWAGLFIAYFATQRTGKAPHSPKNCLPGSGWVPITAERVSIPIDGRPNIDANRYVVAHGEERSLVIYWYHTRYRTVASEYTAKVYTVADAIRYNRSDVAIVKATLNFVSGNEEEATRLTVQFVKDFYKELDAYFPG
ncbi:MAG: EpsI family protein [Candidatus Solibacter usitatus]|nr:EpsI family protein [Candidatus Solibacter usitatus]